MMDGMGDSGRDICQWHLMPSASDIVEIPRYLQIHRIQTVMPQTLLSRVRNSFEALLNPMIDDLEHFESEAYS